MGNRAMQQRESADPGTQGEQTDPLLRLKARLCRTGGVQGPVEVDDALTVSRDVQQDHPVWADPARPQPIYVLQEGLAYSFAFLPGGRRHIDDIFGAGAICNWTGYSAPEYRCNLMFKAGSKIALLDRLRLRHALEHHPASAALFQRHELARTLRTSQRVRALISLPASHRLTNLLLDLQQEYALGGLEDEWLPFGLTQQEIADTIGITMVHVSRTLAKMAEAGELERRRGKFRLSRPDHLKRLLDYRDFFSPHPENQHA